MRHKSTKPKRISGGAQIVAAGLKPMLLRFTPEEHRIIFEAAKREGRPATQFVKYHALVMAQRQPVPERILETGKS